MYQTEEREYPKTIQIEEYLLKRKQIRKNQQIKTNDEYFEAVIRQNHYYFL